MGIDGIGGKGGAPPLGPDDVAGAANAERGERGKKLEGAERFSLERPTEAQAAEAAGATTPLTRLERGEIDLDRYLDLKVDEATRGLEGIAPADLDEIRKTLKDQLATDPALSSLVRQATGSTPREPA